MKNLFYKVLCLTLLVLPVSVLAADQDFFEEGAEYDYNSGSMASRAEGVATVISIEGGEILLLIKGKSESSEAPPGHRESEFELERTIVFKDGNYYLDIAEEEVKGEYSPDGKTLGFFGMAAMEFKRKEESKSGGLKSAGSKKQ